MIRRQSRLIRRCVLAVVLGFLATAAVALLCALMNSPYDLRRVRTSVAVSELSPDAGGGALYANRTSWAGTTWWGIRVLREPIGVHIPPDNATLSDHFLPMDPWARHFAIPWERDQSARPAPKVSQERYVKAYGWPAVALWCGGVIDNSAASVTMTDHRGWSPPPSLVPPVESLYLYGTPLLPTLPLWPGFLVDWMLYAIAGLALLSLPSLLRNRLRRRRGRCIECGYDLRSVPGPQCPECGSRFSPQVISAPAPAA
jgi:hypothetical protein